MSNKEKKEDVEQLTMNIEVEQYPIVKRMLVSLDKFLNRRIASIVLLYMLAVIACGAAVVVNGVTASASDGNAWGGTGNTLLYSSIAVLTFIMVLIAVRVAAVRSRGKNEKQIEPSV